MKSKLHNIRVNDQPFVFWYSSGKKFVLYISPKADKNRKIELVFQSKAPDEDPFTFWAFYKIRGMKDQCETFICLTKPKSIAEILSFIIAHKKEAFSKGKSYVVEQAMDLLCEMGYTNLEPIWVGEW